MDDNLIQNPYKILNVPKDANLATIRSAYRKLVLACHPDKVQDESAKKIKAEQFHQVQQAYEILSDENRRFKYDEKAKLAGLRAEINAERAAQPRRSESYQSPRYSGNSPRFETRNGRVYEERVPGWSHAYEEDLFTSKSADSRPSARKFDEIYTEPSPSNQRRSSGRQQEDRRRMREVEEERERRDRDVRKAKEATAREDKERRRTKERKRDMDAKSSRKFNTYTYMDTDGSDSEMDTRRHSGKRETTPPKRRYEEVRQKSNRDEPRSSNKREDPRRGKDFDEDSIEAKFTAAQVYISKSRETHREVEIEPRTHPSRKRTDSNRDRTPPIAPPMRPVENGRRSSDRERSDKERSGRSGGESDRRDDRRRDGRGSRQPSPVRRDSGKKDKKFRDVEIVEPVSSGRKVSLPISSSDPKGLKEKGSGSSSRKEPHRSTTNYQTVPEPAFKHPGMRRAETMPTNKMHRNEPMPLKSSHLKNGKGPIDVDTSSTEDSDSSDDTNTIQEIKPRSTTHKYKVNIDAEAQSPRTVFMEPEDIIDALKFRRPLEPSATATRGPSNRTPPSRSMSYAIGEDHPSVRASATSRGESSRGVPSLKAHGSSRGSSKLFGAVDEDDENARFMRSSPKVSSPKMSPVDIRYSQKPRRPSEDFHRRSSYPRGESVC